MQFKANSIFCQSGIKVDVNSTKTWHLYFQIKLSAAARLKRKFSTTGVSFRCFNASKVTLTFPPSSDSTASFLRLLIRSFVLTDNSCNGKKPGHQMLIYHLTQVEYYFTFEKCYFFHQRFFIMR